jgi:hypothetical protein
MSKDNSKNKIRDWFLEGYSQSGHASKGGHHPEHPTHPWWKVMCLTGVDYFSTLGYQPSIAFVNAGVLSPIATFVLVLLTLFGALPVYGRIAEESPNGEGSISILEKLLPWWGSKLFVLALLGFAATDFIITITLSAADAAEHLIQNPLVYDRLVKGHEGNEHLYQMGFTLGLILLLSAVFFKGFKEAMVIAVVLVVGYLFLNALVIGDGVGRLLQEPEHLARWGKRLMDGEWTHKVEMQAGGIGFIILGAIKVFPKLALGLSGFETGVAVMPQVEGGKNDTHDNPLGRIQNTKKLLLFAALIMSVYLVSSSLVTSALIAGKEFEEQRVLFTDKSACDACVNPKSPANTSPEAHDTNTLSSNEINLDGKFFEVKHDKSKIYNLTNEEIERIKNNKDIKWEKTTQEEQRLTGHNQKLILEKGKASGRALAFLAHETFTKRNNSDLIRDNGRSIFGTLYDISTILILWFAGASAMAGLLNIIPRYLPRYGMAPEWTRANRPLVAVFTLIAVIVTVIFKADVNAQSSAYATGVLVLMTSAAVAVTISAYKAYQDGQAGQKRRMLGFGLIALIFIYTTFKNIVTVEDGSFYLGDGIKIAAVFIGSIVFVSLLSRVHRTTELRVNDIDMDETAQRFIREATALRFVPNRPETKDVEEYDIAEREARVDHHIPEKDTVIFIEVKVRDSSSFADDKMIVEGFQVGRHKVIRIDSVAIPNAIAAFLLHTRDMTGKIPHAYFNWNEGNPLLFLIGYILSGTGDIAPVTREVLRRAEKNAERRPGIHAF